MNLDSQSQLKSSSKFPLIRNGFQPVSNKTGSNSFLSHLSVPIMNAASPRHYGESTDVRSVGSNFSTATASLASGGFHRQTSSSPHMHTPIKPLPAEPIKVPKPAIDFSIEKTNDVILLPTSASSSGVGNDTGSGREKEMRYTSGNQLIVDGSTSAGFQLQIAATSSFCLWKKKEMEKTIQQYQRQSPPLPLAQNTKEGKLATCVGQVSLAPALLGQQSFPYSTSVSGTDGQGGCGENILRSVEDNHRKEDPSISSRSDERDDSNNSCQDESPHNEESSRNSPLELQSLDNEEEPECITLPHLISISSLYDSVDQESPLNGDGTNMACEGIIEEEENYRDTLENNISNDEEADDMFDHAHNKRPNQDLGQMFRNLAKAGIGGKSDADHTEVDDIRNVDGENDFRNYLGTRSRSFSINHQRSLIGSTVGGSSKNCDEHSTSSCSSDGFCPSEPSDLTLETALIVERGEAQLSNSGNEMVQKLFIREFSDSNQILLSAETKEFQFLQEGSSESFHSEGISTITPISYFESYNSSTEPSSEISPMSASRCERREFKRQRQEGGKELVLSLPQSPQKKNMDFYSVESNCNEFHGLIQNEKEKAAQFRSKKLSWFFSIPLTQIFSVGKRRQDDIHYEKHICETNSLENNITKKQSNTNMDVDVREEKNYSRKGVQYAGTVASHRKSKVSAMKKLASSLHSPCKRNSTEQVLLENCPPSNLTSSVGSGEVTDDSQQWLRHNVTVTTAPSSSNSSTIWNRQPTDKIVQRQLCKEIDFTTTGIPAIPEPTALVKDPGSETSVGTELPLAVVNDAPSQSNHSQLPQNDSDIKNIDQSELVSVDQVATKNKAGNKNCMSTEEELRCVVVLLMEPVLRRFEILQLAFDPDSTLVGDIVDHVSNQATEAALRKQKYVGLCRPAEDGIEMQNSLLMKEYGIQLDEILVALPRGWSAEACCRLATPILKFNKVQEFAQRHTPTGQVSKTETNAFGRMQHSMKKSGVEELKEPFRPVLVGASDTFPPKTQKVQNTISMNLAVDKPLKITSVGNSKFCNGLGNRGEHDDTSSLTMPSMDNVLTRGIKTDDRSLVENELLSAGSVTSISSASMSKVIILIMEPISCHFELLLLQFSRDATVSGVVSQVRSMASKKLFEKQNYIGLCRVDGKEMNNHLLMSKYDTAPGEVLIAIPKGLSGASCCLLAKPILRDPNMSSVLGKMTRSARGDDGNPSLKKSGRSSSTRTNKPPAIPKLRPVNGTVSKVQPTDGSRKENEPPSFDAEDSVKNDAKEKKNIFKRTSASNSSFSNRSKEAIVSLPSITEDNAMDMSECGPNVITIVVLVMNPLTRRFELLQLEFNDETALVGGVLAQVRAMVSKKLLKKQSYIGLCRLDGQELINCFNMKKYDITEGEVLIAIPKGLGGPTCVQLAQPILEYPQIKSFVSQV